MVKEDEVTKIKRVSMLRFGHVERMSESRLLKGIYKADVNGNTWRGRPRKTYYYIDLIGDVLQKGQVRSTRNRRACMTDRKLVLALSV